MRRLAIYTAAAISFAATSLETAFAASPASEPLSRAKQELRPRFHPFGDGSPEAIGTDRFAVAAGASPDLYDIAWTARVGPVGHLCGWRSLPWMNLVNLAKLREAQGGLPHADGRSYPSPPFSWTAQGAVRMAEAAGMELTRRYRRYGACGTLIGTGDVAAADRAVASLPAEVGRGDTGAYRMSSIPPAIMELSWRTEGVHLAVRCGLRSEEWKRRLLIATRRDIAAEINRPETPGPYPTPPNRARELNGFVDGMLAMTERIASKEIAWDATLACAAARVYPNYPVLDDLDDKIAREEYAASKRH